MKEIMKRVWAVLIICLLTLVFPVGAMPASATETLSAIGGNQVLAITLFGIDLFFLLGLIMIITVILLLIGLGIRIVRPLEKGLIERMGRFKEVAGQGIHFMIPLVDKMYKVNLTEKMINVEKHEVITKDNLNASVDLQVYFKVKSDDESVKKSVYNVDNVDEQIVALAQTTSRNVIGNMVFKDVNSKRNKINADLASTLVKETDTWGIAIVRVEMREITPPETVQDAMNNVLIAENDKIAAKDFATAVETKADGERRAEIKKAEGKKKSKILEAEGIKQFLSLEADGKAKAIRTVAAADADKIKVINESIRKNFKDEAVQFKKLETVQAALENNTKFVIDPHENIVNVITEKMADVIVPLKAKTETSITKVTEEVTSTTKDTPGKTDSSKNHVRM